MHRLNQAQRRNKVFTSHTDFGQDSAQHAVSIAHMLNTLLDSDLASKLSANQRAAAAWYKANGDIEKAHTTGVFLKKARNPKIDPVLCVYVDSHARLTDFTANREIYLIRLAHVGLHVSKVEFLLSKTLRAPSQSSNHSSLTRDEVNKTKVLEGVPPLSEDEEVYVMQATQDLPDGLRQKAAQAMKNSLRREKYEIRKSKLKAK